MDDMGELESACFEIIATTGSAKSSYISAVQAAKSGDLGGAEKLVESGDETYLRGHEVHMKLLQREALGERPELSLILLHAEDQMMSAETFRVMAEDFIDVYRRLASAEGEG